MTCVIRPYEPRDLDGLITVWRRASALAHPFLGAEFFEAEERNISNVHLPAAETWVADEEGIVIGFISLIGAEVGAMFVDPQSHRRGVGRRLMDRARKRRAALEVEVFAENSIGREFYRAYGFRETGRRLHDLTGRELIRLRLVPSP